MRTEFRRVDTEAEIRSLLAFDRKVFCPSDRFPPAYWKELESYWMLVDGTKAGCCAFELNVDFQEDIRADEVNPPCAGSLFIASTAILPRFQGLGLGRLLKAWEIAYARRHGFERIVTNTRRGNAAMIALNREFRFRKIRTTPDYYFDPPDATVVMELRLQPGLRK